MSLSISKNKSFSKCHIKKGDTVVCISGDSKKKEGRVISLSKKSLSKNSSVFNFYAIVEGLNSFQKKTKDSNNNYTYVESFRKIHVSNLIKK